MGHKVVLNVLYTNIGRGHPYYLDGVVESLRSEFADRIEPTVTDVFATSDGFSLALWKTVRFMYRAGSQGGLIGKLYEFVRRGRGAGSRGSVEKCLARGLRRFVGRNPHPTLVAHPILVPMISDLVPVYYQHGEIAVPDEAIVSGARKVFVPLAQCRERFSRKNHFDGELVVSGLCIENRMKERAEVYFGQRVARLKSDEPLTGAFFSSGAEPRTHIDGIILAVRSLTESRQGAIVFCKEGGRLASRIGSLSVVRVTESNELKECLQRGKIAVVVFQSRREENELTARYFQHFDYFVAPSHERTNWAVGLGIPMFVLHPIIGTFSPLNHEFLLGHRVAVDIDSDDKARNFAAMLRGLREEGKLLAMAQNGFGKYRIDGFKAVSKVIASDLTG
jgi:hypothetical protein